ncbi:hypothetical protein OAK90_00720 [bacterium]|nr:hypothetical protein [bacterium]
MGPIDNLPLETALQEAESVLCGTSWESDLEWRALQLAKTHCKRSTSVLDHWVNYRDRFVRNGKVILPDELVVGDEYANEIATSIFAGTPVKMIENPYLMDVSKELDKAKRKHENSPPERRNEFQILYCTEPTSEHAALQHGNPNHWGYTEESALRFALGNLSIISNDVNRIIVRPHPSEKAGKYDWALCASDPEIVISEGRSLVEDIVSSDAVVGCNTMAMAVGMLAGKPVYCSIPPEGTPCRLPHREIVMLSDVLAA